MKFRYLRSGHYLPSLHAMPSFRMRRARRLSVLSCICLKLSNNIESLYVSTQCNENRRTCGPLVTLISYDNKQIFIRP